MSLWRWHQYWFTLLLLRSWWCQNVLAYWHCDDWWWMCWAGFQPWCRLYGHQVECTRCTHFLNGTPIKAKSLFTLFYAWKHCNNLKSDNMLYNALQASDSENLASHNPTMSKEWQKDSDTSRTTWRAAARLWYDEGRYFAEVESLISGTFPLFCQNQPVRFPICQHTQVLQVLRRTI